MVVNVDELESPEENSLKQAALGGGRGTESIRFPSKPEKITLRFQVGIKPKVVEGTLTTNHPRRLL